jgi:hypothetical protein
MSAMSAALVTTVWCADCGLELARRSLSVQVSGCSWCGSTDLHHSVRADAGRSRELVGSHSLR